jgi:hypothetical protein
MRRIFYLALSVAFAVLAIRVAVAIPRVVTDVVAGGLPQRLLLAFACVALLFGSFAAAAFRTAIASGSTATNT